MVHSNHWKALDHERGASREEDTSQSTSKPPPPIWPRPWILICFTHWGFQTRPYLSLPHKRICLERWETTNGSKKWDIRKYPRASPCSDIQSWAGHFCVSCHRVCNCELDLCQGCCIYLLLGHSSQLSDPQRMPGGRGVGGWFPSLSAPSLYTAHQLGPLSPFIIISWPNLKLRGPFWVNMDTLLFRILRTGLSIPPKILTMRR